MKKITVILSLLLCLLILCSCGRGGEDTETTLTTEATTEETTTEATTEQATTTEPVTQSESEKALGEFRKQMKDEKYLCGVAYLGYYSEDIGVIIEDLQYKGIYKKHPFLDEFRRKNFHSLEGNELYAVIPAEGAEVTVNQYAFNENGIGYAVKRLAVSDGEILFLRGNVSDIMPNLQLVITDKDGSITEYLPSMSLENGYLSKGQQIWDFSPYDLLGGHFENNLFEEDMPNFIGSWWGEYKHKGELLSLSVELKENGEATYVYGLGNSEVYESFEGSWYKESDDRINIIMYGGPDSFDGSEADSTEKYEFNGVFEWGCTDTNEMFLEHISGSSFLNGTDGKTFHFEKIVEEY
ncbi:MAG: hypothetical protein IKA56_03170 [Clostridia bacterium]|nr:hypothetical protein [Clostridia bacterium]